MDDAIRHVFDVDEPIVVAFRHELQPHQQRLLATIGARYTIDPAAPPCEGACGRKECQVTRQTVREAGMATPLSAASIGINHQGTFEPNWIDFRSSVANVERRRDAGEIPETCAACGCEIDVSPVPHSPKCPRLNGPAWTADTMLESLTEWARENDRSPFASDWPTETTTHPAAREVILEFGSWENFLADADLQPPSNRHAGRRLADPEDARDLLDRMDASEPLTSDAGLEEAAEAPQAAPEPTTVTDGSVNGAAASSSPARTRWTRDMVVAAIQRWAAEHDGQPPTQREWARRGDYHPTFSTAAKLYGGSWSAAIKASGLEPRIRGGTHHGAGRPRRWTEENALAAIRDWAEAHGDPPTSTNWAQDVAGHPSSATIKRLFGSWAAGVEAAGFARPAAGGRGSRAPAVDGELVRVRGTGLIYRTTDEALVAAEEIEADGDRVADQARFDGDHAKADEATARARALAAKIRAAAGADEPDEEPSPARSGDDPPDGEQRQARAPDGGADAPTSAPRSQPLPATVDDVALVPVSDLGERSDAWIDALHVEAARLDRRAAAFRQVADGLVELQATDRPADAA